ncbi:Alpha/beta hydrolase family protein [compost metagenome]
MIALTYGFALLGILTGCADPSRHAEALAHMGNLHRDQVATDSFVLTSFYRLTRQDLPLIVYIEGDGLAWRNRTKPSTNPTPHQAMGLMLAAVDPAANVVYLARPCQFTPMPANPLCDKAYWTNKRFADEVVIAMNQAVSHYASKISGQPIHLIGYSGGGALAVLIAARRNDVSSVRSVAGNLDQAEVNRLHHVSAMPESLNAIDVAPHVAGIAQIHFSGGDDTIVPPFIAQRFVTATGGQCARAYLVPDMNHEDDWASRWPELLRILPSCATRH